MSTYLDEQAYGKLKADLELAMVISVMIVAKNHNLTIHEDVLDVEGVTELREEFISNIMWHGFDVWPDTIPIEDR